jgi:hypothetical protein
MERVRRSAWSGYFRVCFVLSKLAGNLKSDVFSAKTSKSATWYFPSETTETDPLLSSNYAIKRFTIMGISKLG